MSFRAVWEITVNLDTFRNIAVRHACIGLIILRVFHKYGDKKIFAKIHKISNSQDGKDEYIHQKPVFQKNPAFYQSSLFAIKHKN